jgi:uncharacterized protein (TIGR02147 family)
MTQIFEFREYKEYVHAWMKTQPKNGHGKLKQMAEFIRSSPVVMTQVFRGSRELTPEQALGVARFLGLSEAETEYFLLLAHRARSGTHELTQLIDKQLAKAKESSRQIRNRIAHDSLNEEAKALFYSSWLYSATRLGLAIPGNSLAGLAETWGVERRRLLEICDFLILHGLLTKNKSGYQLGPGVVHVAHDHPLVERHHENWRLKALEAVRGRARSEESTLHYTGPMVISADLAKQVRAELLKLVEQLTPKIRKAENEQLHCLNIDWFRLR